MKNKKNSLIAIVWEEGNMNGEIPARFESIEQAEDFVFNSGEIPYGVMKGRTGSYWFVNVDGDEVDA